MPYPSTLTTFTYPQPSDRLNAPSHSSIHIQVASALGQIETVLGRDGGASASTLGTIIGDLRNPSSDGGGHVQGANKGGTGQTSFTKGDLLVATSSSVIAKLAIGANAQVLTADPTQSAGMKWANPTGIFTTSSLITITGSIMAETSIFSTTIPASTLGTSNAVKTVLSIPRFTGSGGNSSIFFRAIYGNNVTASTILIADKADSVAGKMEFLIFADGATNLQRGFIDTDMRPKYKTNANIAQTTSLVGIWDHKVGTSSVDSAASQTFGMTVRLSNADVNLDIMQVDYITVEKIA